MPLWVEINRNKYDRYGKCIGEVTRYKQVRNVDIFGNTIGITYLDGKDGICTVYEVIKDCKYIKVLGNDTQED